jgi:hypothetical protein
MSKYSNTKRLRLAEASGQLRKVNTMTQDELKQQYGQKCAQLGDAILRSRLLGQDIETLFAQLTDLAKQGKEAAAAEAPAPAAEEPKA